MCEVSAYDTSVVLWKLLLQICHMIYIMYYRCVDANKIRLHNEFKHIQLVHKSCLYYSRHFMKSINAFGWKICSHRNRQLVYAFLASKSTILQRQRKQMKIAMSRWVILTIKLMTSTNNLALTLPFEYRFCFHWKNKTVYDWGNPQKCK